jgi:hypothetical protein
MTKSLSHYKFSPREIARHRCLDCGVNVIREGQYCLLNGGVWERALGLTGNDNMCIPCIEARLGRHLKFTDFAGLPTVEGFKPSDLLLDRLGLIAVAAERRRIALAKRRKAAKAKRRAAKAHR